MKSAKTMNCKMCMVERKEILQRMKTNKHTNSSTTIPIFLHHAAASVDFVSFSELIPRH
jgi:hypothetical protein